MSAALRIEDFADDFNPFTALLTLGGEGHILLDPDQPPPVIRGVTLRGAEHVHVVFG